MAQESLFSAKIIVSNVGTLGVRQKYYFSAIKVFKRLYFIVELQDECDLLMLFR
jgi:hypothetical protein